MRELTSIFRDLVIILTFCAFLYVRHVYSYWKRKKIKYLRPKFPFGNFGKNIFQEISIGELTEEFHNCCDAPVIGFYSAMKPSLLVRDPTIIHDILIRDFSSFSHRGLYTNEKVDPLSGNLLFLNGEKWRNLRTKLSPAFTSGKLKAMFSTLIDCGDSFQKHVAQFADAKQTIEIRDVFARYSTNVIASGNFIYGEKRSTCYLNNNRYKYKSQLITSFCKFSCIWNRNRLHSRSRFGVSLLWKKDFRNDNSQRYSGCSDVFESIYNVLFTFAGH